LHLDYQTSLLVLILEILF